jgi:GAF domain-containing protein
MTDEAVKMLQRDLQQAQQAAWLGRRQIELSRQLSTFLGDVSLALDAEHALPEMLQLVAEQARELVDAECCVVTVTAEGQPRAAEAASYPEGSHWQAAVRWLDLPATYRLLSLRGGAAHMAGEELAGSVGLRPADGPPPQGWIAASLTTLDGQGLGAIQLFDKYEGSFTHEDEETLVHLTQMASAAVDRARLYRAQR